MHTVCTSKSSIVRACTSQVETPGAHRYVVIEYTNHLLGGMVGNESSWCVVKELTYVQTTNDVFDLAEQTPFFP